MNRLEPLISFGFYNMCIHSVPFFGFLSACRISCGFFSGNHYNITVVEQLPHWLSLPNFLSFIVVRCMKARSPLINSICLIVRAGRCSVNLYNMATNTDSASLDLNINIAPFVIGREIRVIMWNTSC
jgi:hypothetical protein